MSSAIEVSIGASPTDAGSWQALAREVEDAGFRGLMMADHPGSGPTPFVGLAAAASVTTRLRLGTYVVNAGVRDPVSLAADAATLDVVSAGRADLGIGAGHTPYEWEVLGRNRPPAQQRVADLVETTTTVRALLAGETVPAGAGGSLVDLELDDVAAVQRPVPVLIGGGNRGLLRWAGGVADAVGLSGLGRTLPDGHRHEVRWSPAAVDAQVAIVAEGADAAEREVPPLDALVQHVEITDDRRFAAAALADALDADVDDVLAAPYVWIGTVEEIADQITVAGDRWGIRRWTVREPALAAAHQIMTHLA